MNPKEAIAEKALLEERISHLNTIISAPDDDTAKVTIGAKVSPQLKLKISQSAKELGMTISSYCEMILSNWGK